MEFAALQLALDNEGFSSAIIDGLPGPRTDHALAAAREAGCNIQDIKANLKTPWTDWNIPSAYTNGIATLPSSWAARAKLPAMGYETVREKITEQFHVSTSFLHILNPAVQNWETLPEGTSLKVPALTPIRLPKAEYLEIILSAKIILARNKEGRPYASFPCSIAAKKEKRPVGWLTTAVIAPNPDYLFDPALFPEIPEAATLTSKLMIPPGPNNPVGVYWLGLGLTAKGKGPGGIGIHGTPHPEDIGKTESHGCFRLANWDIQRLAKLVKINTPVLVKE
ncbi:MAG: L,D-transpeptidase [Verrucomicrobiae bacterium]|nr:L,D-transpeptidase [Verrucomicrobiae bacterium]